jgi:hypothetical protein
MTPEIAGVVHASTKIEIVKYRLRGSGAGMEMPDCSVLVSSGDSVLKIDPDENISTLAKNFRPIGWFDDGPTIRGEVPMFL